MAVDERVREAFDSTRDTAKQLITLATSILTVSVTFQRDTMESLGLNPSSVLVLAWVMYAVSAGFGVLTLLTVTQELAQPRHEPSLTRWSVRCPPWIQGITFMAATALVVWFGSQKLG